MARARKLRAAPTRTEDKLWIRLRKLSVRFRRQAPIGPYTVDFACHRACLVIEVDGGVHNLPEVAVRDLQRDEWLRAQGYRVIRFSTKQVEDDIEGVLAAIRNASPLPLDGEGVGGWGGGTLRQDVACEASSNGDRSPAAPSDNQPASTPSQPSPVEGEGYFLRASSAPAPRIRGVRDDKGWRRSPKVLWKNAT
ncbi:endonuclease domain-containing protein [Brevundimonas sp.]|uniref:endonuclease domain-containing protein n=1 Tax=Brevundimonas sp. TaxID=1871086 RepID=UPI0027EE4945|nr:endonuclease domain-containing protein [Brevundimonas sp.]MDQ7813394.1 endonuclease domain-containing protein [Brevundimonas sp.]